MATRTYRLDHDLGFAPNPFFGWCTLACCMPAIRKYAAPGDIIVGMAGSGKQGLKRYYPQLIYWMRVDEAPSFDDYWRDPRFVNKKPQIPGPKIRMIGDRTYRHELGRADWSFETSMHFIADAAQSKKSHASRDTKVDRILIGKSFTYWGRSGPELPDHLISLFPVRRAHKCHRDAQELAEFHQFIDLNHPQFVVGDPIDWDNTRYFES